MEVSDKGIHICTWDNPWDPEKSKRAQHPYAKCIYDGGFSQTHERYECPCCGKIFSVELPQ
jgi:hypothetical protein